LGIRSGLAIFSYLVVSCTSGSSDCDLPVSVWVVGVIPKMIKRRGFQVVRNRLSFEP
jgi:hypothetical protein